MIPMMNFDPISRSTGETTWAGLRSWIELGVDLTADDIASFVYDYGARLFEGTTLRDKRWRTVSTIVHDGVGTFFVIWERDESGMGEDIFENQPFEVLFDI